MLPPVIRKFREKYPDVELHLHQGTSEQIADMASRDRIDFAINTGSQEMFSNLVLLPCYRWHRRVVVPHGHPLANESKLTLEILGKYPIVTYVFGFTGPSSLQQIFARAGVTPRVALTARDADVIKTYVRLGLGSVSLRAWLSTRAKIRTSSPSMLALVPGASDVGRISSRRIAARFHVRLPANARTASHEAARRPQRQCIYRKRRSMSCSRMSTLPVYR